MRTTKFAEEQIVSFLWEVKKGGQLRGALRRVRGAMQAYFRWQKKNWGIEAVEIRSARQLEHESAQFKHLLVERKLNITSLNMILREKGRSVATKGGMALLASVGFSQRSATRALGLSPSDFQRERRVKLEGVEEWIIRLAKPKHRCDLRQRTCVILHRLRILMSHKRVHKIFQAHSLEVCRRSKMRIRKGYSIAMRTGHVSQTWSRSFVRDRCLNGEVVECLSGTDEFANELLPIAAVASFKAKDVMLTPKLLFQYRAGHPFSETTRGGKVRPSGLEIGSETLAYLRVSSGIDIGFAINPVQWCITHV